MSGTIKKCFICSDHFLVINGSVGIQDGQYVLVCSGHCSEVSAKLAKCEKNMPRVSGLFQKGRVANHKKLSLFPTIGSTPYCRRKAA